VKERRISHSAGFLLDMQRMQQRFCIADGDSLRTGCKEADQAAVDGLNIGNQALPALLYDHAD
jgi:hypothetical protein